MTRISRILVSGLLAGLSAVASAQQGEPGLHSLARAAGKLFFGTATDVNNFNDTAYMQIVSNPNEFGVLVPENSQKWQPTEPTQNKFAFTNPDQVRSLAVKNGVLFRCHTLTWFQQLPQFLTQTTWTRDALTAAIQTHIANVVGHYAGSCYSWDVVNEALNDGNGTFRNSVFFATLGTDFIPISFRAAAAADPAAKLYYNDFSLEFNGSKTDAALDIVRLVQDSGAHIDGVGFQAHLTAGGTPSANALAGVLRRFTALGVEVALTELDVRVKLPAGPGVAGQQARDYQSAVGACLAVERCVGVVLWQFSDRYSWVPSTFPGTGDACLYDRDMQRKPAWTSVSAVLAAAATRNATVNATVNATGAGAALPSATGSAGRARPSGSSAAAAAAAAASLAGGPTGVVSPGPVHAGSGRLFSSVGAALLSAVSAVVLVFA